jgi:hypothetical protein
MLDPVAEECVQELEDFALLPQVKCDDGVLGKIKGVGERLRGQIVLDWQDLELLESVRLFDVYSGAQVPDGNRSLAFALRFRAADRTLSAPDIAAAREGAIAEAASRCGATLR